MCDSKPHISAPLLDWYDRNARDLAWRVPPARGKAGQRAAPYHVWLSEIMLQQTTVAVVRRYFIDFTDRWADIHALANARDDEVMEAWAGLGYYARARNLLKCARQVAGPLEGEFPRDRAGLQALPGIGPYTAAAIAAIAFDLPETVVDGNVERVMARLFALETPLPDAKKQLYVLAQRQTPTRRAGDYAQAVMDLGAVVCTPRNPRCAQCPVAGFCKGRRAGIMSDLPRRKPRAAKPVRYGISYVVRRADGALLLERRPARGLLGGMLGWPGTEWGTAPLARPPLMADWRELPAEVRHTFTHFHLRLRVHVATAPLDATPETGTFIPPESFSSNGLPSVMRKVYTLAQGTG